MAGSDEGTGDGFAAAAMSPAQSRAARGLLGWSEADLAARLGLGEDLVRAYEAGHSDVAVGQVEALRSALAAAGAVFTGAPTPGVHLAEGRGAHGGTAADEGTRPDALTTENDR